MRKLFHNCKGAVTVMVTLLLIPSILVSGTGVDLARIYTAKSVVQDANQLAANSVLAGYEALLQDLYGLFGVMTEGSVDPDAYIKQAGGVGRRRRDSGGGFPRNKEEAERAAGSGVWQNASMRFCSGKAAA